MEYHQIANIFPMMGEEELLVLADDIMENGFGLHQPIVVYEERILDGRNQYRANSLLESASFYQELMGEEREAP